ncbi:EAL domain-containing protein [Pseudomonas sp. CAU 1711]|uniref:putative bifunctional diguanylate cyclase/phosphodiesterase n=1 Tax=Pseudomonas sp. CAU 1711 TaxID=3140356 RepID=UPI0032605BDA
MSERIVIATADDDAYRHLQEMLGAEADGTFAAERCGSLVATAARLREGPADALLLDLQLPDSQGLGGLRRVHAAAPRLPVMLLCAPAQQALARRALQQGAQGYLCKGHAAGYLLAQTLHGIIRQGRQRLQWGRSQVILDSIGDAVIGTDLHGSVDYLNGAAEAMTGWPSEEAVGQPIERVMALVGSNSEGEMPNPVGLVLQQGGALGVGAGTLLVRRDGTRVAIEDSVAPIKEPGGGISGAVVVFHDVTEARARVLRMAYLAQHDALTRLPNRVLLNDRIAQAIGLAQRKGHSTALMFLDLDNFKQINDSLGHAGGDQLLQAVAQRLSSCVRGSDTVSRNGGDEFVVLLAEGRGLQDAGIAAQKILATLAKPHRIEQQELRVTSSIGISVYPADAGDAETLLKNADTAMYHAKQAGRNNYQFFRHDMNQQALERQRIESGLGRAQQRHELLLHYQPRVDLATGVIVGAEALLRWRHPSRGLLLPERFLAQAEACGLIVPIGRWALREACRQALRWQTQGLALASMTVKLSAVELRHPDLVGAIRATLEQTGLSPYCLQLDIGEAALLPEVAASAAILQQLKALGVQLALADFGEGCCNLRALLQLPFDVLKIDRSCIQAMGGSGGGAAIAGALVALAGRLGYQVVAAGVESPLQLALLKAERCREAQGFLFGRGLPVRQFSSLLQAQRLAMDTPKVLAGLA